MGIIEEYNKIDGNNFTEKDFEIVKKRFDLLQKGSDELIEELTKVIDNIYCTDNDPIIGNWIRTFQEEIDIIYNNSQIDES